MTRWIRTLRPTATGKLGPDGQPITIPIYERTVSLRDSIDRRLGIRPERRASARLLELLED